jgi:menaquinol-cytochrome c reductase iron-sulfur subunit
LVHPFRVIFMGAAFYTHTEVRMPEVEHEGGISRRSFVTGVVAALGGIISAIVGIPAIGYLISPGLKKRVTDEWVPIGKLEDIPLDTPTLSTFTRTSQSGWERTATSYGVYVIRHSSRRFDVFSNTCTHLSCRVAWEEEREAFVCPCHDGLFARDGSIISGPQPRGLDEMEHRIEDDTLMVHLTED